MAKVCSDDDGDDYDNYNDDTHYNYYYYYHHFSYYYYYLGTRDMQSGGYTTEQFIDEVAWRLGRYLARWVVVWCGVFVVWCGVFVV